MGKSLSNSVFDAALAVIATCTRMDVTSDSSTPANLTNSLADVTLTAGDGNGDYVIGEGDVSGRKLAVAQQSDVDIDVTGTARHVVLSLTGTIHMTTTCTEQALTDTGTVTIPTFDIELTDPT